jgi:hypothetical protein
MKSTTILASALLMMCAPSVWAITGTTVYTDCYGSGKCGNVATTDTCSGNGTCPSATWTFAGDSQYDRCAYSAPDPTPGTPGEWVYVEHQSIPDNDCGSTTGDGGASVSEAVGATETASSSYQWGVSAGLKAGVNCKLAEAVGISLEGNGATSYTQGLSNSSSSSVTYTNTCSVDAPGCGKKKAYRVSFKRSEPASTNITFTMEVQCVIHGLFSDTVCYGWHTQPWANGSCTMNATLTNASEDSTPDCRKCDLTCAPEELHQDCCGSATTTGPCPYTTYSGGV